MADKCKFNVAEALKSARDYIPAAEKAEFVSACAGRCFDKLRLTADGVVPLPDMYKENTGVKERYLLGALLRLYFGEEIEAADAEKDPWLMAEPEYDRWAELHIISQIQRAKGDTEIRDRCFDLLGDYWALEKQFNAEINGMLRAMNDPVTRILSSFAAAITPKRVQALSEEIGKLQEEIKQYPTQKDAGGAGGNAEL